MKNIYIYKEVEISLSKEEIISAYKEIGGGLSIYEARQTLIDAADKLRDHGHNALAFGLDEIRKSE